MYLDIYLACRAGASNLPNVLYYGGPDGRFRRADDASGATGPTGASIASGAGTAESAVSADFDLDGFLDIFVTNGLNMRPRYVGGPGKLFRNNGNSNRWLLLDLEATASNRDAVGAIVKVTAAGITQTRVQNGGYHRWSQEHTRMHFGMATAQRADLVIDWPSGLRERHEQVPVNRLYRATEGGGLEAVAGGPTPRAVVACGTPSYDPATTSGFFVWQVCGSTTWHARTVAGGSTVTHSGRLRFDVPYDAVTPISLEQNDTLDTSDSRAIALEFTAGSRWEDGVRFGAASSSGKCFTVNGAGNDVFLGRNATRVPASFNPASGAACGSTEQQ
jgi:hypothetical protein